MLEQVISNKAGWTRVAFGDVVRKVNDKVDPWESGLERYVAGDHMDTDDLRIRRWGLIGDDYLGPAFHMRFKPGHVLYGSRRTYLRKVALADFEGITANTTYVLESKDPSVLMPELLPFIMQTEAFHTHSIARSKGSVNPYINFSDVACFEFSLPPIQEQARQLELFSQSEKLRVALDDAVISINLLRESVFANEILRCNDEKIAISKLVKFSSGKSIKASDLPKQRSEEASVPVVGGNGIAGFTAEPLSGVPIPCIAVGRVGAYCGAVHYLDEQCWISDNALFVKDHSKTLNARYLELCLRALHLNNHATGGAQPLMTQGIIGRLKIPVPELSTQDEIVFKDDQISVTRKRLLSRKSDAENGRRLILSECYST